MSRSTYSAMRRTVSKADLICFRQKLCEWHRVAAFEAIVDEVLGKLRCSQLFNDPAANFTMEAWTAVHVAVALGADSVRLVDDEWPDFEVRTGHSTRSFEVTEVDVPGRRRGAEYRDIEEGRASPVKDDPIDQWRARAELIPTTLAARALAKAGKHYPRTAELIIHLNIDEWGIAHDEVLAGIASSTEAAASAFAEVWVFWKRRVYLAWSRGEKMPIAGGIPTEPPLSEP